MKAIVTLLIAITLAGCSLEAARTARINSQLKAAQADQLQAPTRPESECKALDNVTVYTMYGAEISLGAGVGAGALAAATEGKTRDYATAVGIGTAAVAGTLAYWSSKSAAQWAERCQ